MALHHIAVPSRPRSIAVVLAAVVGLAAAGCGGGSSGNGGAGAKQAEVSPSGDIPDNQAYVAYSPPGSGYSVKVPEGWARTASGGATTFTDKLNSVRMEIVASSAVPAVPAGAQVTTVRRSAGTATRAKFIAAAKPDPVTGKVRSDAVERYVFRHGARAVVLTLSGPKGADNVDPWKLVTDSLRFTR